MRIALTVSAHRGTVQLTPLKPGMEKQHAVPQNMLGEAGSISEPGRRRRSGRLQHHGCRGQFCADCVCKHANRTEDAASKQADDERCAQL